MIDIERCTPTNRVTWSIHVDEVDDLRPARSSIHVTEVDGRRRAAGAKLESLLAQGEKATWMDLEKELMALASAGPAAAPALGAIRACLSLPKYHVKRAAAVALAFVGRDRSGLAALREDYSAFFADSTMAFAPNGEIVAQAIVYLEPDDAAARRALGLTPGPLLTSVTRRAIRGPRCEPLLRLLLSRPDVASAARDAGASAQQPSQSPR